MKDSLKDHLVKADAQHTFQGYPLISDQVTKEGVGLVWRELERLLRAKIPGNVVEFGCYAGTTSLFIRRLLDAHNQSGEREFHVYDSFEGLPPKTIQDNNAAGVDFEAGKLYVSKADFMKVFRAAHLQVPIIHKGWFSSLAEQDVPRPIAFAFLDGDFYQSIIDSLRLVWPRMTPGGTILIDDYKRETLPGVERAITDFFQGKQVRAIRGEHNIAVIHLNN